MGGHIDGQWFLKSLLADNMAHWLEAAVTENGFFQTTLDRQWRPQGEQFATLVSQSRLLFVFATGYELTKDERYLAAVRKGAEFLAEHLRDNLHGGWYSSCRPDGTIISDEKVAYGQAFVVFGMAHAYRVTGELRYLDSAMHAWRALDGPMRDCHGGIRSRAARDFSRTSGLNDQNPLMHLFEALLVLHQATEEPEPLEWAGSLADFIFAHLYDESSGSLAESATDGWRRLPAEQDGRINLGHAFEWAFLFSHAVQLGLPDRWLAVAAKLLNYGLTVGYDKSVGGIYTWGRYDHTPIVQEMGWWQQCELLRTLMRYASEHGRDDLWPLFDKSLAFVRESFLDAEYGGWYARYDPRDPSSGRGRPSGKGLVYKVGYHVTGMHLEALRQAGRGV